MGDSLPTEGAETGAKKKKTTTMVMGMRGKLEDRAAPEPASLQGVSSEVSLEPSPPTPKLLINHP